MAQQIAKDTRVFGTITPWSYPKQKPRGISVKAGPPCGRRGGGTVVINCADGKHKIVAQDVPADVISAT